jgi:hypothetical protein
MRPMGWKKDKFDEKDREHMRIHPVGVLPEIVDMKEFTPPVRDQGGVSSCTGHGIGGIVTAHAIKLGVVTDEWFSPTWIYNGARFIEGNLANDDGAYPRDAFEWIRLKGCLPERFWPYDPEHVDKKAPPSSLDPEAKRWPVIMYYRVAGGVPALCDALAQGNFIAIGAPWYDLWNDPFPSGTLQVPTDSSEVQGGHETFMYGYDRTLNAFLCQNSWGVGWGKGGRFTMPFAAIDRFKRDGGYDAYYMKVEWQFGKPREDSGRMVLWLRKSLDGERTWEDVFKKEV